jgi:hypothetical protein
VPWAATRATWLAAASLVITSVVACGSSSPDHERHDRAAAVYASIIRWFAEADETDPDPLAVFVEPRGEGTEIALEVQAQVVSAVRGVADVRFVDTRDESLVRNEGESASVVDDGSLIRLGPVNDSTAGRDGVVVVVDVDVYDGRVDGDGEPRFSTLEFVLVADEERWEVTGTPEELRPD